jgi:putative permease
MIAVLKMWSHRYLSDPQAILLLMLLTGSLALLMWMGDILAPVFASIVIAYVLQWIANILQRRKVPRWLAISLVYGGFLGIFLSAVFIVVPMVRDQLAHLFEELPAMVSSLRHFLYLLPEQFPDYVTTEMVDGWLATLVLTLKQSGKQLFTFSLAKLPGAIAWIIYVFLVPMMVFFLLKDYRLILGWLKGFLPQERSFLSKISHDVDRQIGNYIRGKGAEVLIVGAFTFIAFYLFGLRYAVLLSALVGLSVLVPYIGAVIVTIPVVLVAFFQWGLDAHFAYLLLAYGIVQTFDGVVLVPLLFSEAVNLHPMAIIVAVLVFGGWWGFWGIFFAIPLAAFVKAILESWPVTS